MLSEPSSEDTVLQSEMNLVREHAKNDFFRLDIYHSYPQLAFKWRDYIDEYINIVKEMLINTSLVNFPLFLLYKLYVYNYSDRVRNN